MTVDLAKDVEDFLQEQVSAGTCSDPAELINDMLRSLRDQQRQTFEVTPELEAWLLEAADRPATPLTGEDFLGIRQRARARQSWASANRTRFSPTLSANSIGKWRIANPAQATDRAAWVDLNRHPVHKPDIRARLSHDLGTSWKSELYVLAEGVGYAGSVGLADGTIVTVTGDGEVKNGKLAGRGYTLQAIRWKPSR
jgi:Arc/MetJ-type ribon-helix-helix transcriptional regulator